MDSFEVNAAFKLFYQSYNLGKEGIISPFDLMGGPEPLFWSLPIPVGEDRMLILENQQKIIPLTDFFEVTTRKGKTKKLGVSKSDWTRVCAEKIDVFMQEIDKDGESNMVQNFLPILNQLSFTSFTIWEERSNRCIFSFDDDKNDSHNITLFL